MKLEAGSVSIFNRVKVISPMCCSMCFHDYWHWNTEIVETQNSPLVKMKLSARQGHEYMQSVSSLIEIHLLSMNVVYVEILHTAVHRFISCSILLFSPLQVSSVKKRPSELIVVIKAFRRRASSSEAKSEFINKLSLMKIDEWQHMNRSN